MRIAHVSDIHVGAHDDPALDGLGRDLHDAGVAATIVTGDLTMRARTHEFERAAAAIAGFPQPAMVVIGNHDVPLTNPLRRMSSPYARFRTHLDDDLDPFLDLGAVRVQGLGSMPRWRWKSGRVSDRQAADLRAAFADAPPGTARVVALHHPPSSGGLAALAGGGELERALVAAEVDVVLAGHTHVPAVQVLRVGRPGHDRAVVEVVAGTATSHRIRAAARSWSLLEFGPGTLTVIEHHAEGRQWTASAPQRIPLAPASHRPGP